MTQYEEPTRLQEDQSEPGDEPDRVYEAEYEKRMEDVLSRKTSVVLDRAFVLEAVDLHDGEQLVDDNLIDHIELIGNKLVIEVDSGVRLP